MGLAPYLHLTCHQRHASMVVRVARPCITRGSFRKATYVCSAMNHAVLIGPVYLHQCTT